MASFQINPKLPKHFLNRHNETRSPAEIKKYWNIPFILTHEFSADTYADYAERCDTVLSTEYKKETEEEFNHTQAERKAKWEADYPTGIAYSVHCLDGGSWDRPTWWGDFNTLEAAKACCRPNNDSSSCLLHANLRRR